MKKPAPASAAIIAGLFAILPFAGCDDDDNEVRDQPDGVYYDQQTNQNPQYYRDDDRRVYYGEHR